MAGPVVVDHHRPVAANAGARASPPRRPPVSGSGCRPPAPGGAARAVSRSTYAAPGRCPAAYSSGPGGPPSPVAHVEQGHRADQPGQLVDVDQRPRVVGSMPSRARLDGQHRARGVEQDPLRVGVRGSACRPAIGAAGRSRSGRRRALPRGRPAGRRRHSRARAPVARGRRQRPRAHLAHRPGRTAPRRRRPRMDDDKSRTTTPRLLDPGQQGRVAFGLRDVPGHDGRHARHPRRALEPGRTTCQTAAGGVRAGAGQHCPAAGAAGVARAGGLRGRARPGQRRRPTPPTGFVWRLQDEDGNATSIEAFEWDAGTSAGVIVNMCVWRERRPAQGVDVRRRAPGGAPPATPVVRADGRGHTACWWARRPATSRRRTRPRTGSVTCDVADRRRTPSPCATTSRRRPTTDRGN